MTLERSYYSSIRSPSTMRVRLVKNIIPSITPRPEEGIQKADFSGFTEYSYHNNDNDTVDEIVTRPIGSFGNWAKTPSTDDLGNFSIIPTIDIGFGYDIFAEKVYIFVNSGEVKQIRYTEWGEQSKTVDINGSLIEISSPDGSQLSGGVTVELLSATPNSIIDIGAIVIGDVLEVEKNDIRDASINSIGDVTGAKTTSKEFNISLYDADNKYTGDYNIVAINHLYGLYTSPIEIYIIPSNGVSQDISGIEAITKIKATDIITHLSDVHTYQDAKNNTTDIAEISAIIESARKKYWRYLSIAEDNIHATETKINTIPIFEKSYNVLLQGFSLVGGLVYNPNNDIINALKFNDWTGVPVNFLKLKEVYKKPVKKEYPIIKNLKSTFTNSAINGKETIFENLNVDFIYLSGASTAKIKLPNNYRLPTNSSGYIFLIEDYGGTTQAKDITDIGLSYEVEDGYLYMYEDDYVEGNSPLSAVFTINADKISTSTISIDSSINLSGEDLQIKSDLLSLPSAVLSEQGVDWQKVLNNMTESYNYNIEYTFDARGRFDIQLYDVIYAEVEKNIFNKCVVTKNKLTYNGAYKSEIKAIVIDETPVRTGNLTPNEWIKPSDDLTPKGAY